MRIINFDDGYTSATAPVSEMPASSVAVTPSGNLLSTNAQSAFQELQGDSDTYAAHVANTSNPHSVTKTQVGLSAVTNDAQVKRTEMGAVSGVATLDSGGKVPTAQLPDAVVGSVKYQGTWNASTNTPTLASSVGSKGDYYVVTADGTTALNSVSEWKIGDWAIFNGSIWQKIDNTDAVASVAGRTGVITLTSSDVGLSNVDNTSDATKNAASATLTNKTLTSPVINTPTGIVKGDVGLGSVDNTSDATKNAATVALTNKTINGASNTLTVRAASDITGTLPIANGGTGVTSVTAAAAASAWAGWDANLNLSAANHIEGYATTATAAATTTLVVGSKYLQYFTGTTTQTVALPVASTLVLGQQWQIVNLSTGTVTINSSGGNLVAAVTAGTSVVVTCILASGTNAASWSIVNTSGSGSGGSGEKNYITSPSNATNWSTSGAGITVATDTTAADLPRPNTSASGILLTGVSGSTAYAYFRFILDDADANKKLKLQFDMKPGTAVASDFKIDVYSNTASDYSTGNTRLALSTDSSAVSALPALTGTYRTTFDAPAVAAKYIEVRIGMNASATHTLVVSDVIVGPGIVVQGAALSEWAASTITCSLVTNATTTSIQRRVGDMMEYEAVVAFTGTNTQGDAIFTLPTGDIIDTSKVMGFGNGTRILSQSWASYEDASGTGIYAGPVAYHDTTTVYAEVLGAAGAYAAGNVVNTSTPKPDITSVQSGDKIKVSFAVPLTRFAGSGTVNVVQNDVEYAASTTGTWDAAAAAANSVYGPSGATITGALTANRAKVVQFQTPITATDKIDVEFNDGNGWVSSLGFGVPYGQQGSVSYGVYWTQTASNQLTVNFRQYAEVSNAATYAQAGSAWTNGWSWRVRKSSGGQAVGFGEASTTSLGLVKPSHTALAGSQNTYSAGTGLVRSGTYTTTLTNSSNVAASAIAANSMIWSQVGQVVTCSGYFTISATSGAPTETSFTLTLPVVPTSNFAQLYEAGGTSTTYSASGTAMAAGQITATTSAKTVTVTYEALNTTATRGFTYHFTYLAN